jgi:hypothetical protein
MESDLLSGRLVVEIEKESITLAALYIGSAVLVAILIGLSIKKIAA